MKHQHTLNPDEAYRKAWLGHKLSGKRSLKQELIILTDPFHSCIYAKNVIKGRWIEAEDTIMTDPVWTHDYAVAVIKGKLPDKMHNMMILHAIKDPNDIWVKEYFEFIK